jgi:hypothetical protein
MLEEHDVERIARRVVELLHGEENRPHHGTRLIDAATLAARLGVERHWIYAHRRELGAVRLGGPRGRLRFDLDQIPDRLAADTGSPSRSRRPEAPTRRVRHREVEF